MKYFKHKTSIIDKNCIIGKNSKIWHWTHISKNCKIGLNCTIGQNIFIGENVKIGNNVKIQNNVSVYQGVTIEDDVFCGPSVVFTNVKYPLATKKINKNNYEKTLIKKGATLGANSTILCGVTIGMNSLIGAGSVVIKNVDKNSVVVGNPALEIAKVCNCKKKIFKKPYRSILNCKFCNFKSL
jgi:UDP-2-acetamido-3-amino-2,3-dideoxy-glucuronate N-acetyltransferase